MDKRAWITAIVGILLPVGVIYFVNVPPLSIALGGGPVKLCRNVSVIVLVFITPMVLTIIAKRRPFLWGLIPYLTMVSLCTFVYANHVMRHFDVGRSSLHWILPYTYIAIAVSGIGVALRRVVRARDRKGSLTETNATYSVDPNACPPQPM